MRAASTVGGLVGRVGWVVVALALLAAAGCGEDKCAGVRCSPGRTCQPSSGACAVPDAGL